LPRPKATPCDFLKHGPIRAERTDTRSFEGAASAGDIVSTGEDENEGWLVAGGVPYSVARKTGKAAMVGKIEGLGGNLGDIAWIDEAGLA